MTMTETAVQALLPLKTQWFHILLSLAGGEQHGYGIMQEVLDRTSGKVRLWPATLYGSIKRLIEANLIEESDERPSPELDDARRRYYPSRRSASMCSTPSAIACRSSFAQSRSRAGW
jgi:hypothetical protein